MTKTLSVSKLVVMENSTNMVNPNVDEGFEIPEMTVKSGTTLTLKFDKDRDYTFTKPIYLEGGTLEINGAYGSGVITGLDVRGNGTVIFGRGTVSGNVEKTVKTVMYNQIGVGGNIDIPDHGNAVDQDGNTVHKFAYKAETDYDYFDRVCIIRKVEERDFLIIDGKFHKAENGDKMLYLWTDRADRPHRIDAYPSTDSYENGQPLSLKYGTNTFAPGTPFTLKENGVFVAKAGDNVVLSPLAGGNPTDLQKSFVSWVKWYVSKDGGKNFELVQATQGPTAGNSYSPDTIRFEYVIPEITAAQNGYIYRCEVCYCDVIEWDRPSYYYDATLYVDMMQLKEPDRYADGQPARLEMTHGTTLDGVTFGYRWELSRNNGKNWETVQDGASAVYETAAVTDAMEGWQIRVVYSIYADGKKLSEGTTDPVTIGAIGKRPVINEHPESVVHRLTEQLDDDFPPDPDKITIAIDTYYSFSVKAEGEDLHYRWQRSKDNGRTFEDLSGEDEARTKGWYKVAAGTTWQYRCIVYNDFGSVISNVATTRTLYPPTTSNPQDLTVPEHTDAVFRVDITQGLPYGTDVIWQVSKDGKTMADVTAEDGTVNVYSESVNGSLRWYTTLTISNVSQNMSGYMYRCIVKNQPNDENYNGLRRSRHATLTVTYNCAVDGHKFDEGTVTSEANCTDAGCKVFTCSACGYVDERVLAPLGHDWKAATCRSVKTCQREGCGVSEGGFDYTNHTGEPVWSYNDGGHTSKWNCCNTPDQPYSPHVYDDDANMICKVCGYDRTVTPPAHEHRYGDWSKDGTNHWHECTDADCPEQSESIKDKAAHVYTDDADTTCNICGYVRTVTPEIVPVSQITLNKAETSISVGNSETLTATVAPGNAANKALNWASSDTSVATVAADGTVTAVKAGTATITATATDGSGKSAACTVTVTGDTTPPAHEHRYGDWSKDGTNHWHECIDAACPEQSESIKDKAAHIYDDDADTTCNICGYVRTVTPPAHEHRYGDWSKDSTNHWHECTDAACPEQSESIKDKAAHIYDDDADTTCNICGYVRTVTPPAHEHSYGDWSKDGTNHWHECTDADCPERSESIKDKAAHVYTDDADTTCNICGYVRTVTPEIVPVSQITLNKAETSISVGNSETLTATVAPENATIKALTWASSDEDVATVAPDGTVTAVKVGTATITATATDGSGKSATCKVTVTDGTTPSQPGGSTGGSSGGSSSGGGGGSSSTTPTKPETATKPDGTKVETVTKPDGTTVKTETKKDGSVSKTETKKDGSSVTENKAADGSTGTVKTDRNGQTTAETTLSGKAVEDAKKSGEAVKAPVEVEASRNSNTAPTVKVELPKGTGETKVEIPVSNATPGTVAVLVHPDGTEELLKDSIPTEDGIRLTVDGSATVKIVDNSKGFIDIRDHWAEDAIDFVSARGLVNGMSATIYAPNNSTTRAQLWTILARQADADLTGGNTWYEKAQNWAKAKGVSDGANPNAAINRAQMVTMLWRTVGQPTAGGTANFTDVSADSYYAQAVSWAVENGITTGVGGGKFDPAATCTRAQIAAFLARSMK